MNERVSRGAAAECRARAWLESHGLILREANYRCRWGEIDLVMEDGDTLVFVEVRYRSSMSHGGAIASINARKRKRLCRAADDYLARQRGRQRPGRFDVVALGPDDRVEWITDAFDADD